MLNVGAGSRTIALPRHFEGWKCDRLDIDANVRPDICLDARELTQLPGGTYDAIYSSHNLEHFHRRDAVKVLRGFRHVLKPEGFVEVIVPDLGALFERVVQEKLDVDDVLYNSPAGPIQVRDMIYGYHKEIEESGNDFFLHKTGYTVKSLSALFVTSGFPHGYVARGDPLALVGFFFIQAPSPSMRILLGLPEA
jgi:predicted SAM-dependent methyltransferase